ncbi:UNKNOWN [Stylonychia lemnae]|uniref:Uncharacterized protein n=1 Tax=Stylonychia lemnae TaxID=5949 RepID=A0A078B2H2_STYLE|nr:UNKNOWN [Stylonychia lemnae]|eukprot:CDW87683.1 UNKNOWN [Stylonychia lemnae]
MLTQMFSKLMMEARKLTSNSEEKQSLLHLLSRNHLLLLLRKSQADSQDGYLQSLEEMCRAQCIIPNPHNITIQPTVFESD